MSQNEKNAQKAQKTVSQTKNPKVKVTAIPKPVLQSKESCENNKENRERNKQEQEKMDYAEQDMKRKRREDSSENPQIVAKKANQETGERVSANAEVAQQITTASSSKSERALDFVREHAREVRRALNKIPDGELRAQALESLEALEHANHRLIIEIAKLETKNTDYKNSIKTTTENEQKKTYAGVVQLSAPRAQTKNVEIREPPKLIVLKAIDKSKSVDQARETLNKTFNPSKEGVQVKKLRKTRDKIIMELNTEEDIHKIESSKNIAKKFEIERPTRKRPRVIVYDASSHDSKE